VPSTRTARSLRTATITLLAVLLLASSCSESGTADPVDALGSTGESSRYRVEVEAEYPHDRNAFTQGLVWAGNGELFESTGRRGQSTLRRVDIVSGGVLEQHDLAPEYFAEGLALVDDRLVQLTWQEATAFVYDERTFETVNTFSYEGEGWGLCNDGDRLVMSDGSSTLTFRDADTFDSLGDVRVTLRGASVDNLNELECVGDRVYANVLGDDRVLEIDPATGEVTAEVDASSLYPGHSTARDPLNGIAYAEDTGHFFLTGKNWPTMYEVTFVPID
jgi:glutamine cyclotransferase